MTKTICRLALVGSGPTLYRALETLGSASDVAIAAVADVSGTSDATRRAERLGIRVVVNPLDVFRTEAAIVLELNGDTRQYERLLAVKPSRVEVMSAQGARLLLSLLARTETADTAREGPRALIIVARKETSLFDELRDTLRDVPGLRVLLDRRERDRRKAARGRVPDRRVATRRLRPDLERDLRARGFAVVRPSGNSDAGPTPHP